MAVMMIVFMGMCMMLIKIMMFVHGFCLLFLCYFDIILPGQIINSVGNSVGNMPVMGHGSKCGEPVMPHRACKACGNYNGRQVLAVEAE